MAITVTNLTHADVYILAEDHRTILAKFPCMTIDRISKTGHLPPPAEGVYYIVSAPELDEERATGRTTHDLLLTVGEVVRVDGWVVGYEGLTLAE